jgi:hypothetical protein
MAKIRFESLKCEVDAPEGTSYTYDGEVAFLALHMARINASKGRVIRAVYNLTKDIAKGFANFFSCYQRGNVGVCWQDTPNNYRTAILRGYPELVGTFVRGHEETHALSLITGNEHLEKLISENGLKLNQSIGRISLDSCGEEFIANTGGQLAVFLKHGKTGLARLGFQLKHYGIYQANALTAEELN